ncbi:metal-dependent hydrolase [Campylobacter sp. MIT 21-1685]|uniref:aminofutalosine deaminase family hydrolase n=1 Tax=unclassified Campylobacter TaxID=2593542 RepID=UPI00224AFF1D|nr:MULTISPECIES: metal-dependent hydrolase [unclassified Campylobacter]MCX2682582.1 metal-dependent hydrolase [Campylobacter sp. MIT 21-1684]MCX2750862.1 metal-dependent hydrolase [Campylobacter sp. MIT 21-1682]MCX2807205.1 metal-dependent hydrolase [Campylobacter sp. MIT 21-1685]
MFLISAKNIFVCNKSFDILENQAFVFEDTIKEFGTLEALRRKYPQATVLKTPKNSVILPSFINVHTHLEFSANTTALHFGEFLSWLNSVVRSRPSLSQEATFGLISKNLKKMQKSGIGTIGEISSFGKDLNACVTESMRGMRIVFFNEILGTNEEQNERKKAEFLQRFEKSLECKSELFIPAVSIHSPYSTNVELASFALDLAKKYKMPVSTHFLESKVENTWLRKGKGKLRQWLKFFSTDPKPFYSLTEFIELFKGVRTLWTHCVYLQEKEYNLLDSNIHSLTHCAFSNFLLSQKSLNLKKALKNGLNVHIGTDGLSSNISLSMLDELRANLLIHKDFDPRILAPKLLQMATLYPAQALNINAGELIKGKSADFSIFTLDECVREQLPLQFLLHANEVTALYIKGRKLL